MSQFTFEFEEACLTLGKDKNGKRQSIALISGIATIEPNGRGREMEWEIVSVELQCPILSDKCADVTTIEPGHPLFNAVVESIEWDYGDKIWDEALEAGRPDPDAAYDRMRDERMEREQ